MGFNGVDYELRIPEAIREDNVTDIRTRFRRGAVRTVIESEDVERTVEHTFDAFSGGVIMHGNNSVPPGQAIARRIFITLLVIPPFVLLGESVRRLHGASTD